MNVIRGFILKWRLGRADIGSITQHQRYPLGSQVVRGGSRYRYVRMVSNV